MDKLTPERLLHELFMPLGTPFRLFKHTVDWHVTVHWHDFFELALVVSGEGTHILNGQADRIGPGSLFLLTPADFHEILPDSGEVLRLYNAIFVQGFIRHELFQWLLQDRGGFFMDLGETDYASLESEFRRMWEESETPKTGGEWIIAGALERVLVDARRINQDGPEQTGNGKSAFFHPSVGLAVTYLNYHFRDPVTLEGVARHSGLSANYFSECFRRQTGTPFQTYLQDLRLQFAYSLLSMTKLPVTEICYASGFGNLSHFERAFKNKYGRTPRQSRTENAV